MDIELILIVILPIIINIGLAIFLVFTVSRHGLTPSGRALVAVVLGASLWAFGYSMEFLVTGLEAKIFWGKFQYLGITTVPLAWFSFGSLSLGSHGWVKRSLTQRIGLSVLPAITMGLVWTNEMHGLIWRDVRLQALGSFQILAVDHGPGFWLYLAYGYFLLLIGSIRLASGLVAFFQISHWRTILRLIAILIPWFGNFIYVTGLNPIPNLDWSPLSFTFAGLLLSISLFRFSLVDILPIAQKTVFEVIPDSLFVLDASDHLVSMNAAAQKIFGDMDIAWHGKPLAEVNPELSRWVSQASLSEVFRADVVRGNEPDQRSYDLRIMPLTGSNKQPIGRLVVCHDITQHKQEQAQLEQARDQLEEAVAERTAELRWAVEQLRVELAQRTLAERRFEDVIEAAPDAMLLVDPAGTVMLVNAQAERLFGYSREELLGANFELLIPSTLRKRFRERINQFLVDSFIRQVSFGFVLFAQRRDGGIFPVEISLGTLNTTDGVWIACNARDITERKKAEEEQNRLLEEIKQSREQLRALAVRLSEAQEYEQRQVAIELHDRVGQNLTGLNLNLQAIQNLIPVEGFAPIRNRLEDSISLVEETTRQVRSVMADLDPPLLEEYGLSAALRFSCEKFMERTGIETVLFIEEIEPRLSRREEMALFRIIQEGLNNIAKHARATRVETRIETDEQGTILTVEDNGQGFTTHNLHKADDQPHWGLLNVQERAASIGGEMQIYSAPGQGTCLKIVIQRGERND
jgi:two-component system sensor histidine kinase UhpB